LPSATQTFRSKLRHFVRDIVTGKGLIGS